MPDTFISQHRWVIKKCITYFLLAQHVHVTTLLKNVPTVLPFHWWMTNCLKQSIIILHSNHTFLPDCALFEPLHVSLYAIHFKFKLQMHSQWCSWSYRFILLYYIILWWVFLLMLLFVFCKNLRESFIWDTSSEYINRCKIIVCTPEEYEGKSKINLDVFFKLLI